MLPKYLKQKKRQLAVLVLVLVCSLLLCQDVLLNRVLCVKSEGEVKLEYTFFNYHCPCQDEELSAFNYEDLFGLKVDENCHLHIPLADSYLARILPAEQNIFYKSFSSEIDIKIKSEFDSHMYQFHHLLPYIRYLQIFTELNQYFILLC